MQIAAAPANKNVFIIVRYQGTAPVRNSDVGMPPRLAHPCTHLVLVLAVT